MKKIILIKDICQSESPQVRAEIRKDIVEEYAEEYKKGKKHQMPMPVLFDTGKKMLIADGWHRIGAMSLVGLKSTAFEVVKGTKQDCLKFALQANAGHGIRRTNADKRAGTVAAVKEFTQMSNHAIAELASVGNDLVAEVRKALEIENIIPPAVKRMGRDGIKQQVIDVETINETKNKVASDKVQEKDSTGYPIPTKSMLFWRRRDEPKEHLDKIASLARWMKQARDNKDLLFVEVNFNAVEADLGRLSTSLSVAIPYAVCPTCQGQLVEKCKLCVGRGVVSKFKYNTVPEELRKIREKK